MKRWIWYQAKIGNEYMPIISYLEQVFIGDSFQKATKLVS